MAMNAEPRCPNGHPNSYGQPFCVQCGAPVSVAQYGSWPGPGSPTVAAPAQGWPGYGYPPPTPPPPKGNGGKIALWIVGGVVVVVAALVAATMLLGGARNRPGAADSPTATTSPTTTTTVAAPEFDDGDLDAMLLTPIEAADTVGAGNLEGSEVYDTFALPDPEESVIEPDSCTSAVTIVLQTSYRAGADVRAQYLNDPDGQDYVSQGVTVFRSAERAGALLAAETIRWQACANQVVSDITPEKTYQETLEQVVVSDNQIAQVRSDQEEPRWKCQHVLRIHANLAIDTQVCGFGVENEAVAVAQAIVDKADR
ncbi:hypothetical protein MBRU_16615 [Mycolicibacterium brumae DSM 44177]|nr:hypothetical protein MBRU_16615 [Mycolicibacterium brumae DSM 44177]